MPEPVTVTLSWEIQQPEGGKPALVLNGNTSVEWRNSEPLYTFTHCLPLVEGIQKWEIATIDYQSVTPEFFPNISCAVTPEIHSEVYSQKGLTEFCFSILPYRSGNDATEVFRSITFRPVAGKTPPATAGIQDFMRRSGTNAVLSQGTWIKMKVTGDGLYRLSYQWLKNAGADVDNLDPNTIKIYGNHGGMLPMDVAAARFPDLQENAIIVNGAADGRFNPQDEVLFWGENTHKWLYDTSAKEFRHQINYYDINTWYFLTWGGAPGKRISSRNSGTGLTPDLTVTEFDDRRFHEDESNCLKESREHYVKGGRQWLGERFDAQTEYSFTETFANAVPGSARLITRVWASSPVPSSYTVTVNGNNFSMIPPATSDFYLAPPVSSSASTFNFTLSSDKVDLRFRFNKAVSTAYGFLDYYEIHAKRQLKMAEPQMQFSALASAGANITEYQLNTAGRNVRILDITDPLNIREQEHSNGTFRVSNNRSMLKFMAFDGSTYPEPEAGGTVTNQNLHAAEAVDYIIVAHPSLMDQAARLAEFHRSKNNLSVLITQPQLIYNEYSSGAQDITALRDFFRDRYENASEPKKLKYVLLLGDASFDYKDRLKGNTNLVPTFESLESTDPELSYASDDYFACLTTDDGNWEQRSFPNPKMEIAIGRLPVRNAAEADAVVNKILNYNTAATMGDWRNQLSFIADDAGAVWENEFVGQSEYLNGFVEGQTCNYNIQKVYLDAFKQVSIGGGERYPDVVEAINKRFEKGALVVNYIGHGGEKGLAHEEVITIPQINSWENKNLPVFFTATCEFSRYDDPLQTSAGELTLFNPKGGAVALYTTTRVVYSSGNFSINSAFWTGSNSLPGPGETHLTMGDIYKEIKNRPGAGSNDRRFCLLGDPALKMAYPENKVITDSINGEAASSFSDTLGAFEKVTVSGRITDGAGNLLSGFSGRLYPTVFDKAQQRSTLQNDLYAQKILFNTQDNIIYKGRVSISNGKFRFSFIIPKDINYKPGTAKISYYAENGVTDASGCDAAMVIGGSSSSSNCNNPDGPQLKLYLDDSTFKNGSVTHANPVLIAEVFDEEGINTSGTGIGHDITCTLDKGTEAEQTFVLNDYYSSRLDSYKAGEVRYQLRNLPEGHHTLDFKVWDICNNSSEGILDFHVGNRDELLLDNVISYPNPFSSNTTIAFGHNKAGQDLKISLTVTDLSGRTMTAAEKEFPNAPARVEMYRWDGTNLYGMPVSNGMYLYRIEVSAADGTSAAFTGKLALFRQ